MRARTASASLFVTAALILAPVNVALADTSADTSDGVTQSDTVTTQVTARERAMARKEARRLEARLNSHRSFVLGGAVTAVVAPDPLVVPDPAVVAPASTLTFTVHGGRYKVLRGLPVTVTVEPTAKITRDGVVTLDQVLVGDHVVVKSHAVDVAPVLDAAGAVAGYTLTMTVHRVAASPTDASVAPVVVTDPVVPAV